MNLLFPRQIGVGLTCLLFSLCIQLQSGDFPQVEQYSPYDIHLKGSAVDNPYLAHRLWADWHGPNGKTLQTEGFWNGGTEWIIRVALTDAGLWNYTTHATDALLDQCTGTLECLVSQSRGFVKQDGRHFYYQDGTPFFRLGDTCWRLYRSKNAPFETHFKPYIDARAEQGFTFIIGVIHTLGDPSINEGGSLWEGNTNLDRLRPQYFEWVDKRVQYMVDKGLVPGIMFVWADTFDDFYQYPYNRDTFSRFRRYVVARYAAYNVFWIVSGEYTEQMSSKDYDYHGEDMKFGNDNASDGLYDIGDPYGHPISIHPSGMQSCSRDYPLFSEWLGYITQQQSGTPAYLYNEIMRDRSYGLPVCNDEFGYEGPTDPGQPYYHKTNQTGRYAKEDAWTMLCAGAYFIWGNVFTYTGKEYMINTDSLYTEGARYMSILSDFVQSGINYTEMEPAQHYIRSGDAYCLAKHESEYLFYFPKSTTIQINLQAPHHIYESTWLNPVTGETFEDAIVYGDRVQSKTSPFADDAVLYLHTPRSEALGVELSYFNATIEENSVLLEWKTESEHNHAGFIVERSIADSSFFAPLSSFAMNPDLRGGEYPAGCYYSFRDKNIQREIDYYYRLVDINLDGKRTAHQPVRVRLTMDTVLQNAPQPHAQLFQNAPNPFNKRTAIFFALSEPQRISLTIYNANGQIVHAQKMFMSSGHHIVYWDGTTHAHTDASGGIYFYELATERTIHRKKMVFIP
ncbi:DUF4038 domain-containing protein [candidate division KSB1 bacterium]|nr:DUF4038 domain-containing protein [candidate division KSB1 bacterium]RQW01352.1 MAG: DUF4038 domain-containing protein [candidate division KSB1 bacterium]